MVHDTREGALPVCWEGEAVEYSDGTTTSHNSTTLSDLCSLLVWATDRTNDFLGNNIEDRNFVNFYFGPHDIRHRHLQGTMVGLGPNIPPTTIDPSLENLPRDVLCRYHLDQRFFTFSIFSNKSSLYDDPWQYEWKEPLEYVMAMATVEEGVSYRFFHRREWVQKAIVAVVVQILDDMETEIVQKENAILYGVEGFESTFSPLLFRVVGGRAINFTEQVDPCLPDWTCWKGVPSIQLFPTDQVLPENSTEADGDYRQARQEQAEDFEQRLRNFLLEEPQVNGSIAISSEFEQIVQSHVPDNVLVTRIPEAFLADPPTTAPTATPSASEAVSCNTIMSLFFVSTFILSIVDY